MGAYLGNNKKLKLMVNNVAFKIYSGKIVNCVHAYSTEVITPTCTTQGYTKHSCSLCGNTYNSDYVAKLGHTIEIIPGKEATTTTPGLTEGQKCKVCGKILKEQTEIPIHVHSWGDWETIKEATETAKGLKQRSCNNCGLVEEESIPELTHTHRYTSTVIAPTCEEGGYTQYKCSCNHSYTADYTPATGHTWSDWVIDSVATETTDGTSHRDCSTCNSRETATIPATGHRHVPGTAARENEKPATCETNGKYDLVVRCTGCGNIISSETKTIAATGHTEVVDVAVAATCTVSGLTEGKHCSVCSTIIVAQNTVPATGHTEVIDAGKDATCTETGLTAGKHCSVCNTIIVAQSVLPAIGHVDSKDNNYICDVCGAQMCTDHELEVIPAVAATCTTTGLTEGQKCNICGKITVAQNTIPAKGHTEVIDNAKAATCTETGLTAGKHCSVCNTVIVAQSTIPAKGHTEVIDAAIAPTCTATGLTEGKHCSVCNTVLVAQTTVDKKAHSYKVTTPAKAVTCTTDGATAAQECEDCHDKIASVVITKTGHDWETGDPICLCGNGCGEHNPDWGEDGKCIQCGKDCWHDYVTSEEEVPPTCTEAGHKAIRYCGICGAKAPDSGEKIPSLGGHDYFEGVCQRDECGYVCTHPMDREHYGCTCPECDETVHNIPESQCSCTSCGYTLPHDPVYMDEEPATCTTPGATAWSYCGRCGTVITNSKVIEASGHDFGDDEVCDNCGATCTHPMDREHYGCICPECDETVHNYVNYDEVEPTCNSVGYTGGYFCGACGFVGKARTELAKLTHDWVSKELAQAATCTEDGLTEAYYCGHGCGASKGGEVIPASGHSFEEDSNVCTNRNCGFVCYHDEHDYEHHGCVCPVCYCAVHNWIDYDEVAPTCTTVGYTGGYFCGACGVDGESRTEIKALGHEEETVPGWDATCTEVGWTDLVRCSRCDEVLQTRQEIPSLGGHDYFEGVCQREECRYECTHPMDREHYGCTCPECDETVHNWVDYDEVEPTCTSVGYTGGTYCAACGTEGLSRTEIPAHGHDWVSRDDYQAPSCYEVGYNESFYCGHCGESKGGGEIEALGHDWSIDPCKCERCQVVIHSWEGCYCADCDATNHHMNGCECEECDYNTHDPVTTDGYDPTCTQDGSTEYSYCGVCGAVLKDSEVIPATGHTYDEDDCTCRDCGNVDHIWDGCICERCGDTRHSTTRIEGWDATCEDEGMTSWVECVECGKTLSGGAVIPALGHDWDPCECSRCDEVRHNMDGCYCTDCDFAVHDFNGCYCRNCDATNHHMNGCECEECDYDEHDPVTMDGEDATCTTAGSTGYSYCGACGTVLTRSEVIPATGHSMDGCYCLECSYENHSFEDGYCVDCRKDCPHTNKCSTHCYDCGYVFPTSDPDECLIASTPILMADGTEKAISEVRAGDMVKSWDLDNNEYVDVEVLGTYCTGDATDWAVHTFDNGQTLTIYNKHRIFCKEKNSVRESDDWCAGNTAITLDGAETKYEDVETRHDETASKRFTMLTENNLYFANGILCGHHAKSKYKFFNKGWLEATPEEVAQYQATAAMYEEMDKAFTNEEYIKQAAPLRELLLTAKQDIRAHRHEIGRIDRDLNKRGRTKIAKKELANIDETRNNRAAEAKRIRDDSKQLRQELDALKTKFGITTKSKYQIWKEAYDLDMKYLRDKAAE